MPKLCNLLACFGFGQVATDDRSEAVEKQSHCASNSLFFMRLLDEQGNPSHITITINDISELMQLFRKSFGNFPKPRNAHTIRPDLMLVDVLLAPNGYIQVRSTSRDNSTKQIPFALDDTALIEMTVRALQSSFFSFSRRHARCLEPPVRQAESSDFRLPLLDLPVDLRLEILDYISLQVGSPSILTKHAIGRFRDSSHSQGTSPFLLLFRTLELTTNLKVDDLIAMALVQTRLAFYQCRILIFRGIATRSFFASLSQARAPNLQEIRLCDSDSTSLLFELEEQYHEHGWILSRTTSLFACASDLTQQVKRTLQSMTNLKELTLFSKTHEKDDTLLELKDVATFAPRLQSLTDYVRTSGRARVSVSGIEMLSHLSTLRLNLHQDFSEWTVLQRCSCLRYLTLCEISNAASCPKLLEVLHALVWSGKLKGLYLSFQYVPHIDVLSTIFQASNTSQMTCLEGLSFYIAGFDTPSNIPSWTITSVVLFLSKLPPSVRHATMSSRKMHSPQNGIYFDKTIQSILTEEFGAFDSLYINITQPRSKVSCKHKNCARAQNNTNE